MPVALSGVMFGPRISAERRLDRQTAREGLAARYRMAGNAVTRCGEIFPLGHGLRVHWRGFGLGLRRGAARQPGGPQPCTQHQGGKAGTGDEAE